MRKLKPLVALLALALTVVLGAAACSTTVSRAPAPPLTYGHLPPLDLLVGRVELVEAYRSPPKEPNVEQSFPTPPALAFKRWVGDRLRSVGQSGTLRVTIRDASALRVALPRTAGIEGLFTKDQAERIDATVDVLLEIVGDSGGTEASVSARAQRSRTLPEGLSLNERDKYYQEIAEALVNDLNATIEQNLRRNLARFLAS